MSASLEDHNIAILTQRIEELREQIRNKTRAAGLGNSAIDDGALTVKDADGTTTMLVGQQFDGTATAATVSGPPPPQASTPIAASTLGGAIVTWDGFYADGPLVVAPMDFARVEVHADPDPDFPADLAATIVGSFESPRGGDRFVPLGVPQQYTIKFVVRALSGRRSTTSEGVDVTPTVPAGDSVPTEAPSSSVDLVITPYAIGFILRAGDIADTSTIAYHVSATSGFTPSAANRIDTTNSQVLDTRTDPNTGAPYVPGVTYYFKTVVSNAIDAAPPGPESAAALRLIGTLDVADLSLTVRKFNTNTHQLY